MYWDLDHITLFYALGYHKMAAHLVELERAAETSDLILSRYTYPMGKSEAERADAIELVPSEYFELTGSMLADFVAIEGIKLLTSAPVIQSLVKRGFSYEDAVRLFNNNEPRHHFWTPDGDNLDSGSNLPEQLREEGFTFFHGMPQKHLYDPRDIAAWLEKVAPQPQS